MQHSKATLCLLFALAAALGWARAAWAQGGTGGSTVWAAVIVIVALLVLIGVAVKLFDLRRRREAEAVQLQAQVSDALLRDSALAGLPITPTARVPFWSGSPATIEVGGQVPIPELRERVLRIVHDEATRIRSDVQIEDRLTISPELARAV